MERRQRVRKFTQVFVILGLTTLTGWWVWKTVNNFLFHSEYFTIRRIEITGIRDTSESEIISLLPFRPGDNLFKVWLSETERNLRQCKPELKDISVSRRWQKILVSVREREPIACTYIDGRRMWLDDDNIPFPLKGHLIKASLPEIVTKNEAERREMVRFVRIFSAEAKDLFPRIVRLYPEPVEDVVFELDDDLRIYWGTTEKEKIKLKRERLAQVLADARGRFQGIEYVNLCYMDDGRVLVKPRAAGGAVKVLSETPAPGGSRQMAEARVR
jgi:cell division septal protein FtsQ